MVWPPQVLPPSLGDDAIAKIVAETDSDGDGEISLAEFAHIMTTHSVVRASRALLFVDNTDDEVSPASAAASVAVATASNATTSVEPMRASAATTPTPASGATKRPYVRVSSV